MQYTMDVNIKEDQGLGFEFRNLLKTFSFVDDYKYEIINILGSPTNL
jgi:hypothetical protein